MGLRLRPRLFYVVVYGASAGSIMWVLGLGILVSWGLRYRLLWFGVCHRGVRMVRKWKWYMLTC